MATHVFFIHGLFMTGAEATPLRRLLARELGARTHAFAYLATAERPEVIAARLARKLDAIAARDTVHLVGHSFGGLIALRAVAAADRTPRGRIVLLGTPTAGSGAAAALARVPILHFALGRSGAVLRSPADCPAASCDIGVIAGSRAAGLGRFFAHFTEPNDGTVAVRETELPGAADRIVLPVSHTGMLLSRRVARETAQFLRYGRFSLEASS
ncbi:MAG: esterase/lipase family protein [Steroidobacteraceae bacterium]